MPKFLDDIIFINSQGKECSVNEYYNNMNQFETKLNTEISERKSFDDSHNNVENGTGADSIVQKVSTIDPTNPADFENTATANGGVAFGKSNTNNGANAIVTGWGNINNVDNALVIGQLNKLNEDAIFAIGNGIWEDGAVSPSRSDAFKILKDGSTIIGGVDVENNSATLPDYQVAPDGWLGFDSTVIEGDQNLATGARNYVRGNYNITSGLFNTIFSTETQKDENGNEKLDENGNPMPELVNSSLAIGSKNQVRKNESAAIGDKNVVTGGNSVALAYKNKVYADASVALGYSNTIGTKGQTGNASQGSVATGYYNTITGTASFAANGKNAVTGDYASAFGDNNKAGGYASFVAGMENESTVQRNFIYGFKNKSIKSDSVLLGTGLISDTAQKVVIVGNYNSNDNIVQGETLFAVGGGSSDSNGENIVRKNIFVVNRSNIYANAKFNFNDAIGSSVAVESLSIGTQKNSAGETVTAPPLSRNYHSIRVGENNTIENYKSGVFGVGNSLTGGGENSFIFGGDNTVVKSFSFVAGRGLQDKFRGQWNHPKFTIGRFNLDTEEIKDSIFVVGNGTSDSNRSNALRVTAAGDVIGGKSTDNTSEDKALTTKDYVTTKLETYARGMASSLLLANPDCITRKDEDSALNIKSVVYDSSRPTTIEYRDLWITCGSGYGVRYELYVELTKNNGDTERDIIGTFTGFNHFNIEMYYPEGQGIRYALLYIRRRYPSGGFELMKSYSLDYYPAAYKSATVYVKGTYAYKLQLNGYNTGLY